MKYPKGQGFNLDSVGNFTILTDARFVFQGVIKAILDGERKDPQVYIDKQENEFIALELRCYPATVTDDGETSIICSPLYHPGDVIILNVAEIVSIGPGGDCLGEKSHDNCDCED